MSKEINILNEKLSKAFLNFLQDIRKENLSFDYKDKIFNLFCNTFLVKKALMFCKSESLKDSFHLRNFIGFSFIKEHNYFDLNSYFKGLARFRESILLNIDDIKPLSKVFYLDEFLDIKGMIMLPILTENETKAYIFVFVSDFFEDIKDFSLVCGSITKKVSKIFAAYSSKFFKKGTSFSLLSSRDFILNLKNRKDAKDHQIIKIDLSSVFSNKKSKNKLDEKLNEGVKLDFIKIIAQLVSLNTIVCYNFKNETLFLLFKSKKNLQDFINFLNDIISFSFSKEISLNYEIVHYCEKDSYDIENLRGLLDA